MSDTAHCDLLRCFQGIIPAIMATCSKDGTPNVTYLSHVYYVDEKHVALSRQFLNKTSDNVAENPYAAVQVLDPVGFVAYSLDLRFDHAETEGPLFETMAMRIQAIATHTGMAGVFKLIAADVYEVLKLEPVPGFVLPEEAEDDAAPLAVAGPPSFRGELRALQVVSAHLGRKADLEDLLSTLLATLDAEMGFEHAMVLLVDESGERLYTIASRGYGDAGIGAEVALGDGLIGTVAERRRILSLTDVDGDMRYGRAIRAEVRASGASHALRAVIPLPGLPDARSQLAIPLESCGRLVGVLAVESRDPAGFESWHESFLSIVGNQAAVAIDAAMLRELDGDEPAPRRAAPPAAPVPEKRARTFVFYRNDDCVFVDDEYLIRNVPGKILWKILRGYASEGRIDYTNRELRLDPWLGLPANKDNLESRLILLRKRLEQKCPDLRMTPKKRGQFRLEVDCRITLIEKDCG